jgi:heme/copper-type cytochrome/quinol oxidase subunit 2
MILDQAVAEQRYGSWRALADLFNEAWRHGRRRLTRYCLLAMALAAAAAGTALAVRPWASGSSGAASARRYAVCVSNLENLWRYIYGAGCSASYAPARRPYSYHDLIVPAGSTVDLAIARAPIAHRLRIPGLGLNLRTGTQSIVDMSFRTRQAGKTYSGVCVTSCGHDRGFASTKIIVVTPAHYRGWLAAQRSAIAKQDDQDGQLKGQLVKQGIIASNSSQ